MTLIPLYLLSAGLSESTDGESLCTHAVAKCWESAHRRAQARQHHKSRRLRSVITDVLYLDEVKAAFVLAGCSPDSNVWGGHEAKERGVAGTGSHPVLSVLRQLMEEEEAPCCSGAHQIWTPRSPDQSRGGSKLASTRIASAGTGEFTGGLAACHHACRGDTCL